MIAACGREGLLKCCTSTSRILRKTSQAQESIGIKRCKRADKLIAREFLKRSQSKRYRSIHGTRKNTNPSIVLV